VPEPAGDLGEGAGLFTTPPFSEPETFTFPAGIGPVECVNVEARGGAAHPPLVEAQRVTFKYGLGSEFIGVLQTLHKLGLDSADPVRVGGASVSPRDVVAACLPDPATLGDKMSGLTCAGTWVTGTVPTGPRATSTCTTWSTTPGPWPSTDPRPWSGRPRSTRWSRWS